MRLRLVAVLFVLGAPQACLAPDTRTTRLETSNGYQCNVQFQQSTCDQCMQSACGEPCEDCQTDPECSAILDCIVACGSDNSCANGCPSSHPSGQQLFNTFLNGTTGCIAVSCASPCEINTAECLLKTQAIACDECINEHCLSACQSCAGNSECLAALDCLKTCGSADTGCQNACWQKYPYGESPLLQLAGPNGCMQKACSSECK